MASRMPAWRMPSRAALRLQPNTPRLQPNALELQPHAPRLQPYAPNPKHLCAHLGALCLTKLAHVGRGEVRAWVA